MQININTEFISLGQLLKLQDYISSGGEAKVFLQSVNVHVNGEIETRRGRKLYPGDRIDIAGDKFTVVKK